MVTVGGPGGRTRERRSPSVAPSVIALAHACHLGPTVAVTSFAAALAVGVGATAGRSAMVALAVLAGQLSVGWSNDWLDAARDLAVGRGDKPVVTGRLRPATLRTAAFGAGVVCVPLSFALGWRAGVVHVAAVAGAWSYNLGVKSTVWSWAPYAFSFGLLPGVATLALVPPVVPPWWLAGAGALLGVGAHLANALPDLEDDAATGVHGLPHRLGRARSSLGAAVVLLAGTVVVLTGPPGPPSVGAWVGAALAIAVAAAGVVAGLARPTSRLPFTCAIVVAGVDVALLVGAVGTLV